MMKEKKFTYKDVVGAALLDYFDNGLNSTLQVFSDISEEDEIDVPYLFRNFDEMPNIEQKALQLCKGRVLDVGAASGCHSLYLQDQGLEVTAIDQSEGAVEIMKKRGVKHAICHDFYTFNEQGFDTILLLMNGIGIAKTLSNLPKFFDQLNRLINQDGQVLLDSSDIKYMFEEEDGSMWMDITKKYYGEVTYQMKYKNLIGEKFNWLFLDFNTLSAEAKKKGLKAELVMEGAHYDFLVKLTKV